MKSGAGDDPFGDPVSDEREDEVGDDADERANDVQSVDVETGESRAEPNASADSADSLEGGDWDDDGIPWVLRRRSVKDDRPNVTQFFLRDETDRAERRFRGEVEERLDTDVYLLDLREAAYVVAMQHPDEVASLLGRWGYDYRD